MNKGVLSLCVAAAMVVPASANAAVVIEQVTAVSDFNGSFGSFGRVVNGAFNQTYTFDVTGPGTVSGSLTAAVVSRFSGITFSSVTLNGVALARTVSNGQQFFELANSFTLGNLQRLNIQGSGRGSFGGSVSFAGAVPETGTWAMFIIGFGAIGVAMRRRRSTNVQVAKVTYA